MSEEVKMTSYKAEAEEALTGAMEQALKAIGFAEETHAKEYCPVDTGRLRNSIYYTSDGESVYIGTNVEYAAAVELGTSRQRAQPYLQPAILKHTREYKEITENALKGR